MIRRQFDLDLHDELIVDNFAGGGGASFGIEMALGRPVDHAINHDHKALGMHRINHPKSIHHCEDVFDVDPRALTEGRRVGLAHFSPDCKHFSKAKGGKPLSKKIRGLALVILRWASITRPRVISMENVEEIETWGPLVYILKNGKWGWHPDPLHVGRTWKAFKDILGGGIEANHPDLPEILEVLNLCKACEGKDSAKGHCEKCGGTGEVVTVSREDCLRGFGYHIEHKILRACGYGSPTIRKRLYLFARCDGRPITWPEYTHVETVVPKVGEKRKKLPWRSIAECIDWSLPCPSIFLTPKRAKALRIKCKRPLAKATQARIAKGIDRYVLRTNTPFLVSLTHQGGYRINSTDNPFPTVTAAHRGELGLVSPTISKFHGNHKGRRDGHSRNQSVELPLLTADTGNRHALSQSVLAPLVTEHANASNQRNMPADQPLRTACAEVKGGHFALVSANLMVNTTEHPGATAEQPSPTITTGNQQALITGSLVTVGYGEREDQAPRTHDLEQPLGTVVGSGKHAAVAATIVGAGGPAYSGEPKAVDVPMNTQTTREHSAIATATLVHCAHGETAKDGRSRRGRGAHSMDESVPTITTSKDLGVAVGTLVGAGGRASQSRPREMGEPIHTITAKGDTCLATAHMVKLRGTNVGSDVESPLHTISAEGFHHGVVAATVVRQFGESVGQSPDQPSPTVMAGGGGKTAVAAVHLTQFITGSVGRSLDEPSATVTAGSHRPETHGGAAGTQGLVSARLAGPEVTATTEEPRANGEESATAYYLAQHNGGFNVNPGHAASDPISTIGTTGSQQQVVAVNAVAYYGTERDGQAATEPARTVPTKDRLGVVESTIAIPLTAEQLAGARMVAKFLRSHGVEFEGEFATVGGFIMVDIGMRMLSARELFRAQGFGDAYIIDHAIIVDKSGHTKKVFLTKEEQIRMCGNSVCPQVMAALTLANVPELAIWTTQQRRKALAAIGMAA